jgi:hypothetical protein
MIKTMNRNSPFATTALNFYADGNVRAREHVGNTPASSFLARLPSKSGNQSGLRDASVASISTTSASRLATSGDRINYSTVAVRIERP